MLLESQESAALILQVHDQRPDLIVMASLEFVESALTLRNGLEVCKVEVFIDNKRKEMICGHAGRGCVCPQKTFHEHRELVADVDHQTHIGRVPRNQIEKRTRYEALVEAERRQCFDDVVACITI